MKFNVGRLTIEVLLTLNDENKPTESIAPTVPINQPEIKPPIIVNQTETITKATKDTVYKITSSFEGGIVGEINYTNLTGNFDGQGMSVGVLQQCVGQDSDRPLFQLMKNQHPEVMKACLGPLYEEFVNALSLSTAQRLQWAIRSVNTTSNTIDPVWKAPLKKLLGSKEYISIQDIYLEKILLRAASVCDEYGLKSMRALSLMFDINTQNGSIKAATKQVILSTKKDKEAILKRVLTEKEYLEIIAIKRAEASNPIWVSDVKSRKLCIVYGTGTVHSDKYDLSKLGLSDAPFRTKTPSN